MSIQEFLAELPSLTVEQRQLVMRRALELDEPAFSPASERIIEERRAEYIKNPSKGLGLEEMESQLRAKLGPRCGR